MAALQSVVQSCMSTTTAASSFGSCKGGGGASAASAGVMAVPDQFPAGLRVMVVDDDTTCLAILEQMLRRCLYQVTLCSQATDALNHLREKKGYFDVVLSDVHMPDMDGFKLLECIGLEMDLPVIMMSADGRTSAVMQGIRHGACDYLIKPIREEELKNIWQHVARKRLSENKEIELSGSLEDNDRHKRGNNDVEYISSVNEGTEGRARSQKKRINAKEDEDEDGDAENDDMSTSKKPRVVWSVELHQQFVSAVNQLGLDKAVPKRILELMNVPGLSRENVASHLQKFRLYLKRLSIEQQQNANAFCGPVEPNVKLISHGNRFDIQALAASGQIPPQTLAALQAELLGQPVGHPGPTMDQPVLHASLQRPKCAPVDHSVAYGQALIKRQYYPQCIIPAEDASSGGQWRSNNLSTMAPNSNVGGFSNQNSNMFVDVLQQEQQNLQKGHQQLMLTEPIRSINVQPSCLVIPSQPSAGFQAGNSPASVNQSCTFNRSTAIDYSLLSAHSNNNSSMNVGRIPGHPKTPGILSGYPATGSLPTPSCSVIAESITSPQNSTGTYSGARQLPGQLHNTPNIQDLYVPKSGEVLDQGFYRNLGFVGKETRIPSRFAGDEFESQSNLNHGSIHVENIGGNPVKQEPNMGFVDSANGAPIFQQFSSSDLTSVFND